MKYHETAAVSFVSTRAHASPANWVTATLFWKGSSTGKFAQCMHGMHERPVPRPKKADKKMQGNSRNTGVGLAKSCHGAYMILPYGDCGLHGSGTLGALGRRSVSEGEMLNQPFLQNIHATGA
jgi:hypothetical protein